MTRVAYIINAYRNWPQVERLVRTLAEAEATAFLIHLDRKSGPRIEADLRRALGDLETVHFLPRRNVYWGRFSVVAATLSGLSAVDDLGLDPDQVVVLSGQDYPIKPPGQIAEFLSANPDRAFVDHFAIPDLDALPTQRGGLDRIEFVHVWIPRRGPTRLPIRRRARLGLEPFGGSAHLALGRDHRRYIRDVATRDRRLMWFFRLTDIPDELFFQTVLLNSPLSDRVVNENLFELHFEPRANHPTVLTRADLPRLAASKALFARKFDPARDPEMLTLVERELLELPAAART